MQWQRVFIPCWVLAVLLLCCFLIYYYFRCLCLLLAPLVCLGCFFFLLNGWHRWTYQGKCCCVYLRGACRRTAGWKMIPGLNSSVYSVQDLLSTVSLLRCCNFWEPGAAECFVIPLKAVWECTKSEKTQYWIQMDKDPSSLREVQECTADSFLYETVMRCFWACPQHM